MPFGFIAVNSKKKDCNQNTVHFGLATYKLLHERSNETASLTEHMKFEKKMILRNKLSVKRGKFK